MVGTRSAGYRALVRSRSFSTSFPFFQALRSCLSCLVSALVRGAESNGGRAGRPASTQAVFQKEDACWAAACNRRCTLVPSAFGRLGQKRLIRFCGYVRYVLSR